MNSNTNNNLCDDWGWYVDTESNLLINSITNIDNQKILCNLSLYEDEYNYHKNNYRDIENLELDSAYKKFKKPTKTRYIGKYIYKIGSTTLITALLTYAIFFLI